MKEFMKSALFFKLIVIPIVLLGTAIVAIMIYLQTYGNKIVEKSAKNYTDKMLKSYVYLMYWKDTFKLRTGRDSIYTVNQDEIRIKNIPPKKNETNNNIL